MGIAISPDGKMLASAGDDEMVHLWDMSNGNCIKSLTGHTQDVLCVTFSNDGKRLASGALHEVIIWDLHSMSLHSSWNDEDMAFESVCFSPDSTFLATGSRRGKKVLVGDLTTDTMAKEIRVGFPVSRVVFSPDSKRLAIAGYTDRAEVWNVPEWTQEYVLNGNGSWLTSIAYSPDGKSLVAASPAGEIRFWRAATGEPTGSLTVNRGIRRAFFAPNGNGIVWASMDGAVEYWSATPVKELPGFGLQRKQ
jgi:WD40 repeat protein